MFKKIISAFVLSVWSFTFISYGIFYSTNSTYIMKVPVPMSSTLKHIPMESFIRFEKVILNRIQSSEHIVATGSGVVIARTKAGNVILTNHHVCEETEDMKAGIDPIYKRVRDTNNRIFYVYVIKSDPTLDICTVFAKGMQAPPVIISAVEPVHSELVYNISAPRGIFFPSNDDNVSGVAPIIMGLFNGYVKVGPNSYSSLYTIKLAPGSSGSGLFNSKGELVGLIHSCFTNYDSLCMGVVLKDIRAFLKLDQ